MRLRSFGWVALAGFLVTPSAFATSSGSAQPLLQQVSAPASSVIVPEGAATPRPAESLPVVPSDSNGDTAALDSPTDSDAVLTPLQLLPLPEPPKPVITLNVDIDLSSQRMIVKSGGQTLHSWPISSGRRGYYTPTGTFTPTWRSRMWYSRQYDGAPMPYAIFFNRGIAVHGTSATGMLGRTASHGCVRLANGNAKTFWNTVSKHGMESTRIVVRGSSAHADKVAASNRKKRTRHVERQQRPQRGYAYGQPGWTWW